MEYQHLQIFQHSMYDSSSTSLPTCQLSIFFFEVLKHFVNVFQIEENNEILSILPDIFYLKNLEVIKV